MSGKEWRDRISIDPNICHGKPCIKGTRMMVSIILDYHSARESHEAIRQACHKLTEEDIQAVPSRPRLCSLAGSRGRAPTTACQCIKMKVKLNESVLALMAALFRQAGHDVATITEQGKSGSEDQEALRVATTEQRVLESRFLDRLGGGLAVVDGTLIRFQAVTKTEELP